MSDCFFVSDLHGSQSRCEKLFLLLQDNPPTTLFIGGDILPSGFSLVQQSAVEYNNFLIDYFLSRLARLRDALTDRYPRVFVILGNDDPAIYEEDVLMGVKEELWGYMHNAKATFNDNLVYGYSFVPPSPFQLKDWEKYDVSRHVDPGAVSPEEGFRSRTNEYHNPMYETISGDLNKLIGTDDLTNTIFLFHSPPYKTKLDRAALDGKVIDHVHLDVHVGSIAIRRMIEEKQPLLTLHGHIHESSRLTGSWRDKIGQTHMFNAAHDGPELAVIQFDLLDLDNAVRLLI